MTTFLMLAALVVVAGLAYYAWNLTRQVKDMEARQLEEQRQAEQALRDQQKSLLQDIQFLCTSVLTEQCEMTEGVMRLQYLVTGLDPEAWNDDNLTTMRDFYSQVSDMPILEAYKKLKPKQQFELDKRRHKLEERHKDDIERELEWLRNHTFPNVFLIH